MEESYLKEDLCVRVCEYIIVYMYIIVMYYKFIDFKFIYLT